MSEQEIVYYNVNGTVIGCLKGSWEDKLRAKKGHRQVGDADGTPLSKTVASEDVKKPAKARKTGDAA